MLTMRNQLHKYSVIVLCFLAVLVASQLPSQTALHSQETDAAADSDAQEGTAPIEADPREAEASPSTPSSPDESAPVVWPMVCLGVARLFR